MKISQLAEVERKMDSGEQPFVRLGTYRIAVRPEIMEVFKLQSGQTISDFIFVAMLEKNIEILREQIAAQKSDKH